ncbi:MAG: transposase [Candidatus Promineifilaceae bacterium]|nr:transposase [Candidatus Promineifilaceae bacterium]
MTEFIMRRYSLAFKKHVVSEYEAGASVTQLSQRYGIKGGSTVARWVKQYGREGLRGKLMVIQKPEEQERVKQLEEQVAELEKLVAQLSLDKFMLESTLAVAEEELGYEIKKKTLTALPSKPRRDQGKAGPK